MQEDWNTERGAGFSPFSWGNMAQEWAKSFYNSSVWKNKRKEILMRDRYKCTEQGCRRTAREVHHIIELTERNVKDYSIALGNANLRSLCEACHKRITKESKHKPLFELPEIFFDEDGQPFESPREGG